MSFFSRSILIVFLFSSCLQSNTDELTFQKTNVSISHDTLLLTNTFTSLSIDPSSQQKLETFDPSSYDLIRYDLKSQKVIRSTSFDSEGPNGLASNFSNLFFNDSISIIITNNEIAILNKEHEVVKRIRQNAFLDGESYQDLSSNFYNRQFYIDGKLYLNYKNIKIDETDLFGNNPLIAELNLSNDSIRMLPIFFPKKWERDGYFWDQTAYPGICINGNKLVYNFSISPNIFVYDLLTNQLSEFDFDDFEMQKPIPKSEVLQFDKRFSYSKAGPNYLPILFDKNRGLYYRVHLVGSDGTGIDAYNMFVSVFDTSFTMLKTIQIDNPKLRFPFVSKLGLGFGYIFPDYEGKIEFTFYDFKR